MVECDIFVMDTIKTLGSPIWFFTVKGITPSKCKLISSVQDKLNICKILVEP